MYLKETRFWSSIHKVFSVWGNFFDWFPITGEETGIGIQTGNNFHFSRFSSSFNSRWILPSTFLCSLTDFLSWDLFVGTFRFWISEGSCDVFDSFFSLTLNYKRNFPPWWASCECCKRLKNHKKNLCENERRKWNYLPVWIAIVFSSPLIENQFFPKTRRLQIP